MPTWSENIKIECLFTKIDSAFGGLRLQNHPTGALLLDPTGGVPSPRPPHLCPLLSNAGYATDCHAFQMPETHTIKVLHTGWTKKSKRLLMSYWAQCVCVLVWSRGAVCSTWVVSETSVASGSSVSMTSLPLSSCQRPTAITSYYEKTRHKTGYESRSSSSPASGTIG